MLFKENTIAEILKSALKLDCPDGYSTGRYRDIYIKDDKVVLYTRNGGGNRDCYTETEYKDSARCACQACVMKYVLPTHPNYLRDYDDGFDSTYAYIEFSIPEDLLPHLDKLKELQPDNSSVSEKFLKLTGKE